MTEGTKVELMKIAASLTHDFLKHRKDGITAGKPLAQKIDIKDVFAECLVGVKDQFDKLGQ